MLLIPLYILDITYKYNKKKAKYSQIHGYYYDYDICRNTLNTSQLEFNVKSKIEHVTFVYVCEFLCRYSMKFSSKAKLFGTKCTSVFFLHYHNTNIHKHINTLYKIYEIIKSK